MKKFNEEHEWVSLDGDIATIGVSKYAVNQLGDITFVELPEIGDEVSAGDSVVFVESVKAASDVYSPLSGSVEEVNEALLDTPEILNEDPNANWILKIKITVKEEFDSLMDEASYEEYIKTL